MKAAALTPAAERMRRLRERRKEGAFIIALEIDQGVIARLIGKGHLSPDNRQDREAVEAAFLSFVENRLRDV